MLRRPGFRLGQAKWDTGTWVYCETLQSYGCVIDAVVDPNMLALPPHVTFDQTRIISQQSSKAIEKQHLMWPP
jgi:hypothetical protein